MDEIFGRKNFIAEVIWQKRTSRENRAAIGSSHDTILVYGKMEARLWKEHRNLLPGTGSGYANPDNDPRGPWRSIPFSAQGYRPNQMYDIETSAGDKVTPPKGRCWAATEPVYRGLKADNRIYFPNGGAGRPRVKQFQYEERGLVPMTIWMASEAGDTEESKKEILALFDEESPFRTPKPERLLNRIITVATNPGDIVCDSFLGSGTTAAVAHKMARRWIGVEMGDHAVTHCIPRMRKVVDGEQGGMSQEVNWKGGCGFRFYRLGPAIADEAGRINKNVRFAVLAAHVWFSETHTPLLKAPRSPKLGVFKGTALYLLYNGILGDKRSNTLTSRVLRELPRHDGPKVIYAECTSLDDQRLRRANIIFRHIPYDLKGR